MKTVVMTGGTSGLGAVAARRIAETPQTRLLLGARNSGPADIESIPLDLARLESVRTFAGALLDRLGATPIDVLMLNAGTQYPNLGHRTVDGFETTFAVNHLAHYLLLRLLLPNLARSATVVITTSDTHDRANNPFAPMELDLEELAHPHSAAATRKRGFTAGFRAYSSSKLCNMLTARALAALPAAKARSLRVIAFNPGLTPTTSLFRAWPLQVRLLMYVVTLLRPILRLATAEQAGRALADLALGTTVPPSDRLYASLVRRRLTWPEPAALARRDDVMTRLWQESARMVGMPA